jgi:hypothetical protein
MNKEEKIRNLIRLKRHETPREGYFEDFLEEFHRRQDHEGVPSQSANSRAGFFKQWRESSSKIRVLGFGMAYAALVLLIVWWPKGREAGPDENRQPVLFQPEPDENSRPVPDGRNLRPPRN